jgi:Flp pilus assembly protein TadD
VNSTSPSASSSHSREKRTAISACALLFVVLLSSACSTTRTSDDALTQLCGQQDLSKTSQRVVLAGGYHALAKKDLVCAERLTMDARQKDLKDPYAALNLGAIYQRSGRIDQARDLYSTVITLDSSNDSSSSEQSHLATRDQQVNKRPADIARHNLALIK